MASADSSIKFSDPCPECGKFGMLEFVRDSEPPASQAWKYDISTRWCEALCLACGEEPVVRFEVDADTTEDEDDDAAE